MNYNTTDYKSINNTVTPFAALSNGLPQLNADGVNTGKNLYNGNIRAMLVNIPKLGDPANGGTGAKLYGYKYDQLNRIAAMNAYNGLNADNTFTPAVLSDYKERVSYDANGNILTYVRNGTTANSNPLAMDNLSYNYYASSNKLSHVNDAVAAGNYSTDIDNQGANNYDYDEIGNLTKDNAEGITSIEWTVYGKIKTINKNGGVTVNYTYDASGNRITKQVGSKTTFYVRDASGNVMAIYEKGNNEINSGKLSEIEVDLYGSSRLGMLQRNLDVESTNWWLFETTAMPGTNGGRMGVITMGSTTYEMSNHLGNVLVTVSDRKIQVQDPNNTTQTLYYTADVVTATDFYPFGMDMPSRTFGNTARYGFNGKERDKDLHSLTAYDYGFRIYNPAIGKFLSVDPLTGSYPELTPYQFASNSPIEAIDLDGLEAVSSKTWVNISLSYDPALKKITSGYTYISANNPNIPQYLYDNITKRPSPCDNCIFSRTTMKTGELNTGETKDPNSIEGDIEELKKASPSVSGESGITPGTESPKNSLKSKKEYAETVQSTKSVGGTNEGRLTKANAIVKVITWGAQKYADIVKNQQRAQIDHDGAQITGVTLSIQNALDGKYTDVKIPNKFLDDYHLTGIAEYLFSGKTFYDYDGKENTELMNFAKKLHSAQLKEIGESALKKIGEQKATIDQTKKSNF